MATKYKALLVGAGGWGQRWAEVLDEHPDVTLAAWVDAAPGVAAQAAEDLKIAGVQASTDLDEALKEAKPDFVVDVSAHFSHHDIVSRALRFGVPVLGEKPMANSMAEAREMVALSEKTGLLYMVSQSRRYDANTDALKDLIRKNLGGLALLDSNLSRMVQIGGYRANIKSLMLIDMAIHNFDTARYISGADPVAVYCDEFNPFWVDHESRSTALAMFEMTNDIRFTFRGSWATAGYETSWQSEWRAAGPHGTAKWDGENAPTAEVLAADAEQNDEGNKLVGITAAVDHSKPFQLRGSLRDFLNALETGATPQGECHDNIKSLAMVFAAIESSATKSRVEVRA